MRRANDPPIQALTVFLLKTGTTRYEDALEEPRELTRHRFKQSVPFEGALFLAPQRTTPPRWLKFVEGGTRDSLGDLFNASTSAVLFVRASRRIFVFTFGYGRALLRPDRIERSFGLRVVLNTVDQEGLRSVDTKTVQELTLHTRRQTSRASRLAEFGVDKEEDLLGAVSGVPRDPEFAKVISGADALQLRARITFVDLGKKCRDMIRAYHSNDYRAQGFEFVDHVRTVTDPTLIDALNAELVADLTNRRWDGVHMSPPEIIDWGTIDGFSFAKGADPEPDLRIESFFGQIRKAGKLSVDRLKRQRVFIHSSNAADPIQRWPVYRVLVAERDRQQRRYMLSGGEWYELDMSFVKSIRGRVARIMVAGLNLPPARLEEREAEYNRRVEQRRGVYCVDRKCPRVDGDAIELCDLYTSRRQFVHVKHWKASSTLSHLFAQGRMSAEAFLLDETFRDQARRILAEKASSLGAHIPTRRPDPSRYQVVFAIIKGGGRGWRRALPFFSQLNLVRSAEAVRRLGFNVRLERIRVEG